jgi:hypothetical protein
MSATTTPATQKKAVRELKSLRTSAHNQARNKSGGCKCCKCCKGCGTRS